MLFGVAEISYKILFIMISLGGLRKKCLAMVLSVKQCHLVKARNEEDRKNDIDTIE